MSEVKAAGAGAAVGSAAAVGTVAAVGEVGLGAIGITSGLAGIGGVVGGGMATGLCIVAAAPIACGLAAFGIYKLLK